MNFNKHYGYENRHAVLSASQNAWTNYTEDKFDVSFRSKLAAARGTELHVFGAMAIRLGIRQADTEATLNRYINDALGFRMEPEVLLYYSENAFGTADAVGFSIPKGSERFMLRIHDLKTGITHASFRQLEVYVAYFCLEYKVKPGEIDIELRIYQNDQIKVHVPELDTILHIMGTIQNFDRRIELLREEMSR